MSNLLAEMLGDLLSI